MHPILAGILAGLLTLVVAYGLWRLLQIMVPSQSPSVSRPAMIGVSILAFASCTATTLLSEANLARQEEPLRLVQKVCNGQALPESPPYDGKPPHPVLFAAGGDSALMPQDTILERVAISAPGTDEVASEWNDQVRAASGAHGLEEIQLVGCLTEQLTEVEVCRYTGGPDITRYRRDLAVRLVEAHTGRLIGEQSFQGWQPSSCQRYEDIDRVMIIGNPASLVSVQPWLHQFVQSE